MCKISIIMPVYNKEKYIKKAIEIHPEPDIQRLGDAYHR